MSAEMRYRASDTLGYVAFLDAGAAGSNVEPPLDTLSYGAGVGVRYYTGFGPLRADIAVPAEQGGRRRRLPGLYLHRTGLLMETQHKTRERARRSCRSG
jgi:outer membrane translocation and assembly module TamA